MLRDNPKFVELIEEICVPDWVYRGAVDKKHIADIAVDFFRTMFPVSVMVERDNEASLFFIVVSISRTVDTSVHHDIQRIE